jgi:tRNA(Ile)-lysidine synthase
MRVLRGCGPAGLAAMPKERGQVLRPLLTLSRSDVLAYLGAKKTSFRTDSTNQNIRYLRNRIRRELVPCLDAFFPYWRKTLLAMAETQSRTAKFLESEARKQVAWTQKGSLLVTSGENFFSQSEIIREESLFRAADHLGKFFSAKAGDFEPDLPKKKTSPQPRRKTLRGFGEGKKIDAGPIRIEHSNGDVLVSLKEKKEKEGALVILSPGIYSFMGFKIACQFPEDLEKKETPGSGFFVHLPLVVHTKKGLEKKGVSGYTAIAEDQYGLPEHIVSDMLQLSWKKETPHREDQRLAFIMVSGGNDV